MKTSWLHRCRFAVGLLMVGLTHRLSPWARAQDDTWFRLNGTPQVSTGLELDGSSENNTINGVDSTYSTFYVTPLVGLQTSGFIYHPNLLNFNFDGEFGYGWNRMTTTSPGFSQTVNESEQLLRYILEINLLEAKPYNASFFAAQDHTYRDYGFFDTYTVDSTRYGGRINWNSGNFSVNTDFGFTDETDTGLNSSSEVSETYFNFLGINKRSSGQTTVIAQWNMFDNILDYGPTVTSVNESVGISDAETFGSRQQITAATGASFAHSEYTGLATDTFNANEYVNINHTRSLDSFLILNFEQNYMQPANETFLLGQYGIRHQLYESLTSTLDIHGNTQQSSGSFGSSSTDLYGVGLSEDYLKRLQSWGHLSVGASIIGDHLDQSSSGSAIPIIDEPHVLFLPTSPQYRPVYLNRPDVIPGPIQVTAKGQLLVEGSDYVVIPSGQLTEIQLIAPPSSHLQMLLGTSDNLAVLVSYDSTALNNASYEQITSSFQVRLDLWGRFGIYGRLNWVDNNAPAYVVTQTLTDLIGGMDYHWRWFRAGAEYEDYDSNFNQYTAFRFYQDFDFQIDNRSTLGMNFNESFYHYPQSGNQTLYQFTTRYSIQLWSSLSWYVQGGVSLQDVLGTEQLNGAAQTGISWSRGKLSVRAGYEYYSQSVSSGTFTQDVNKNQVFAYLRRSF